MADETLNLNDSLVVQALLQTWTSNVMNSDQDDQDALMKRIDESARAMAKIFLGHDPKYQGSKWNTPGQIDEWVAKQAGVDSTDPVERVAGCLLDLLRKLYILQNDMDEHDLPYEQWQPAMDAMFDEYTMILMGIPNSDETEAKKKADVRESAVSSAAFSNITGQQAGNKKINDDVKKV